MILSKQKELVVTYKGSHVTITGDDINKIYSEPVMNLDRFNKFVRNNIEIHFASQFKLSITNYNAQDKQIIQDYVNDPNNKDSINSVKMSRTFLLNPLKEKSVFLDQIANNEIRATITGTNHSNKQTLKELDSIYGAITSTNKILRDYTKPTNT